MADTTTATGLRVQQWDEDFFVEFVNQNLFAAYMGTDENSLIQVKENLTKKQGDSVTFALVNRLTNSATTGSATLEGNEEDMTQRSHRVYVDKHRHAVRFSEMEEQKNAISFRKAARASLMTWKMEYARDRIITRLGSIVTSGSTQVAYATATEAQKDAWLVDNADRVLFGAAAAGYTDHSADLALLDTTADLLTPTFLSRLRRMANAASPKIRPIRIEDGKYYYVCFTGDRAFRDLKTNSTITQAQREVTLKNQNNKLFQGGDIDWDGIIVREVPEIAELANVGDSGTTDVSPVYLCGAQALGYAVARRPKTVTKEFDYGDKYGVAVDTIDGIEKLVFGSGSADTDDAKQNGIVTGYVAVAAGA